MRRDVEGVDRGNGIISVRRIGGWIVLVWDRIEKVRVIEEGRWDV